MLPFLVEYSPHNPEEAKMQRSLLLGAGAIALAAVGFAALRGMTRNEAGKATDQGIQQLLANLPPGWQVTHGPVDYNPLTSTATLHDLKITRPGRVEWTAETLTVSGADAQALRDVFDPASYPAGKPAWTDRRLLLQDMAAHNVHAHVEGASKLDYSIAAVTLHRLSGRPFLLPPTPENREDPKFAADAALAMAADSAEETETHVTQTDGQGSSFTIASVRVSNYDAGKLAAFTVKGMALDARDKKDQPVHLSLGSLSAKDVDAARALQAIRESGHGDNAQLALIGYSSSEMADMAMNVGATVSLKIDDVRGTQSVPDSAGTRKGTGSLHGMTMGLGTVAMPPKIEAAIDAFGMRAITMDGEGSGSGAPGGRSQFDETITLRDLGTLHASGAFSGYVSPAGSSMPAATAAMMGVTLEQASLVWTDASLTDRLFKVAASQAGTTPDIIRGQLAMPILAAGVMVPDQPDVADQLSAFLTHPHKLTVMMNPPQKITLGEVAGAPATSRAHLLGLHVSGN